jgi:hypothetical protein
VSRDGGRKQKTVPYGLPFWRRHWLNCEGRLPQRRKKTVFRGLNGHSTHHLLLLRAHRELESACCRPFHYSSPQLLDLAAWGRGQVSWPQDLLCFEALGQEELISLHVWSRNARAAIARRLPHSSFVIGEFRAQTSALKHS